MDSSNQSDVEASGNSFEHPKPMNLSTKLAYGAGDLGPAITANLLAVFLLIFFTNVAGIPAGMAGSILMIGKIWDAVNDPIVGVLSDRTRSPMGRRYPWILYGAIPFGVFFFLQWIVPRFSENAAANQWALFWYYVAVSVVFNIFYTVVNLPYVALTPELTLDYDERTSLSSFRFAFSIGGSILSLVLALGTFSLIPNDAGRQYQVLGGLCAFISVLPLFWLVWGTRKRAEYMQRYRQGVGLTSGDEPASLPYQQQLKVAFSNRPFLFVIGIYLFSWLAVQNTVAVIPFFVQDWMGLSPQAFTQVVMAIQVTALLMLFVWSRVCQRIGKKAVFFWGMSIWIVAEVMLFFVQPGQIALMYVLAIAAGVGVSTAYLIPWSMIPDVIDLDELNTGQRREGVFYGFMVLLQKFGLAMGLFIVGQILDRAGFIESIAGQPSPEQPASALLAIRILVGPVPALILLFGVITAFFYPISREVHAEILLKLKERSTSAE